MREMITLEKEKIKFNYRAGAVIVNDNKILLQKSLQDNYWILPRGRVELLETAEEAVVREIKEELDVEVTVERLLWISEDFYNYKGMKCHELALYFLIKLREESESLQKSDIFERNDEEIKLLFKWFDFKELNNEFVYHEFLKNGLRDLPRVIQHVVQME